MSKKVKDEEEDEQKELKKLIEKQKELVTLQEQRKQAEEKGDTKKMEDLAEDILKMEVDIEKQTTRLQKEADETEEMRAALAEIVAQLTLVRAKIDMLTFQWKFTPKNDAGVRKLVTNV